MEEGKEVNNDEVLKVKAYNLKTKNIKKVDEVANKDENGNSSKAMNKIVEAYNK